MTSEFTGLILTTLIVGAVAAVAFGAEEPPRRELAAATPGGQGWSLRLELATRYDDNITQLSDTDIDRLDDPTCQSDPTCNSRFRIESASDWIVAPEARVEWSHTSSGGLESSLAGQARANIYTNNSVKDYEVYGLRFAQDLSAGSHPTTLYVRVDHMPDYYLRELTVPEASRIAGTTVRDSGRFASTELALRVRQVLVPKYLDLEAAGGTEQRDYQAPFDERDGDLTGWSALFVVRPTGNRDLAVDAGYRSESYDANGDRSGTEALESDISNDRQAFFVGLTLRWGERPIRGWLAVDASRELRDFTTAEQRDIYHFGREDTRTVYALTVRQALSELLYLEGRAEHEENDSNLGPLVVSTGDDVTDFTQNVYSVSVGARF